MNRAVAISREDYLAARQIVWELILHLERLEYDETHPFVEQYAELHQLALDLAESHEARMRDLRVRRQRRDEVLSKWNANPNSPMRYAYVYS